MSGRALAVFAKPPVPGRVKTRLVGHLSPAQAAALAAAFLDDLLARLPSELTPRGIDLSVAWAVEPGEPLPASPVEAFAQQGEDLGSRLLGAATRLHEGGRLPAVVGADLPDLAAETVEEAFRALEAGADLVLGPASDGGFYLIGFGAASRRPELFAGVPWGASGVLAQTLANARALGLSVVRLAEAADIDRPEDLGPLSDRLAALAARGCEPCPRTRVRLAGLGDRVAHLEEAWRCEC